VTLTNTNQNLFLQASCDVLNNRIRFGILGLAFAVIIVFTNLIVVTQVREIKVTVVVMTLIKR
jgi:hypothetical protein